MTSNVVKLPIVERVKERLKRNRGQNKGYSTPVQRGNVWQVSIRFKGFEPETRSFPSREMAHDWGKKRSLEIKYQAEPSVQRNTLKRFTLGEVIRAFIAYVPEHDLIGSKPRHAAWEIENIRLNKFLKNHPWLVDDLKLSDITVHHWQRQQQERLQGSDTVRRITPDSYLSELYLVRYVLRAFGRKVHEPRLLVDLSKWFNDDFEPPKKRTVRSNTPFTIDEINRLKKTIATGVDHTGRKLTVYEDTADMYLLAINWMLETGVRAGGVCKVKWGDVKFERLGYWQEWDKKSPARFIPLRRAFVKYLEQYKAHLPAHMRTDTAYVIQNVRTADQSKPFNSLHMSERIAVYIRRAGMLNTKGKNADSTTGKCMHMFRHTANDMFITKELREPDCEYLMGQSLGSKRAVATYWHHNEQRIRDKLDPGWQEALQWTPEQPMSFLQERYLKASKKSKGKRTPDVVRTHTHDGVTTMSINVKPED